MCQKKKKKCPNIEKEMYNDKYRHTKDRLFGLPDSKNKADFGIFILVFRINLATLNCHDSKDAILALEGGIQTAQP